MNIKRKWFTPIVMILALITMPLSNVSHADDRARDRKTLQGIQSIVVKVHSVEAEWRNELAKVGLSESALQTSIERQLQKAGIQVTSEESSSRSEFEGILNVRLNFVEPEPAMKKIPALDKEEETIETVDVKKRYIYAIRLNLRQLVFLKRDPVAEAFSITWQTESVGMRRLSLIQERIKSLVDVFIEAYASENPNLINR
ncbi:MAG: hypothetical protein PVF38_19770 [Desulfobacterales bacterium]|jgi:hypothetical protein